MRSLFSLVSLLVVVALIGWLFVRIMGGGIESVQDTATPETPVDMINSIEKAEEAKQLIESRY